MATAPNLNPTPLAPQTGMPVGIDGTLGELFANLMPVPAGEGVVAGQPVPGQPVSGQTLPGQPGAVVPLPNIVADIRPADAKAPEADGEGGAAPKDQPEAADETIATLLAQAEFVPVIQPQAAPLPVAVTSTVTIADTPAPAAAPITVPAPVVAAPAPSPAPQAQAAPITPEIAEAIRRATVALTDAAPAKTEGKGPEAQPPKAERPEAPGLPVSVAQKQIAVETKTEKAKAAPQAAAVERAPAAPAQTAPTLTPVVPLFDPTNAVQTAPAERAAAPQPAPSPDQAMERELDLAHDSEWLDRLARDIARTGNADTPLRFKLHPHTLGHLQVELTQGDHGTSVRLTVETEAARALIADAQPRLAAEARAQGVRLANTEVDLSGSGHQAASGDPRRQEEARQPQFIRTARDAVLPADEATPTAPARTDRYA